MLEIYFFVHIFPHQLVATQPHTEGTDKGKSICGNLAYTNTRAQGTRGKKTCLFTANKATQ